MHFFALNIFAVRLKQVAVNFSIRNVPRLRSPVTQATLMRDAGEKFIFGKCLITIDNDFHFHFRNRNCF